MTWPTHLSGGIASVWFLTPLVGPTDVILLLLGAMVGSLLPDLDATQSRLSNTRIGGVQPLRYPAKLLHATLGHRGALHSFVGLALLCGGLALPLLALNLGYLALGIALGFLSHLLLDACTKSGVPLLWPSPARLHLLPVWFRITTGSPAEDIVFALLAGVNLYGLICLALTAISL